MKVIFLDVDGVLNSEEDLKQRVEKGGKHSFLYDEVEDRPLKLLKSLIDATDAKIVVSSSWRLGALGEGVFSDKLYNKLLSRLADYGLSAFSMTPSIYRGERGDEIRQWLNDTQEEIESFVILDDDDDMCEFSANNLIKTTFQHGLQQEHVDKAIDLLKSSNKKGSKND